MGVHRASSQVCLHLDVDGALEFLALRGHDFETVVCGEPSSVTSSFTASFTASTAATTAIIPCPGPGPSPAAPALVHIAAHASLEARLVSL